MRRHLTPLLAVLTLLLLALTAPAFAQGVIVIMPPPRPTPAPQPSPGIAMLELRQHQVSVTIEDQVATTRVEHVFHNPTGQRLEGTFIFPLPDGANIDSFQMDVNGEMTEAELVEADKARKIYTDIVRSMKDPALLEYAGRGMLKCRVFPIEPNSDKRLTLSYTQLLPSDGGLTGYTYPLTGRGASAHQPMEERGVDDERHQAPGTMSLKLTLKTDRAIASVYSPTHSVDLIGPDANHATLGFESNALSTGDFQVFYATEAGDDPVNVRLMTFRNPSGVEAMDEGHFLLLMSPNQGTADAKPMAKDIIFALDTSGSMAGVKMDQAKAALTFCIANLNDEDSFQIIRFSTEAEGLFSQPVQATKENRDKALAFIKDLKPTGGTAIQEALAKALEPTTWADKPRSAGRPYYIIFLTDGKPTIGETDPDTIVTNTVGEGKTPPWVRVFSFGIGTDVNTRLLDRLSQETKATTEYVLPDEDIEVKVSRFYSKISEPILSGLELTVTGGDIKLTKMSPANLPDLFKGQQLVVTGRYRGTGDAAISLTGQSGGAGEVTFAQDVTFPEAAAEHTFIPRLWATRRVGFLLDEMRLRGDSLELREEVTSLARDFGIVTPYTSYLIVEDERQRNVPMARQTLQGLAGDAELREETAAVFREQDAQSGAGAVGAAASNKDLADGSMSADDALRFANERAELGRDTERLGRAAQTIPPRLPAAQPDPAEGKARSGYKRQLSGQATRHVNGRTFIQNGTQWVDTLAQSRPADEKPVQITFNSDEYFDLIAQHPDAAQWLSVGTRVQVVIDGTFYEVIDAETETS